MITAESWAKAVFSVVNQCHYPGHQFHVGVEGNLVILRVVYENLDVTTEETQMGRPWVIEFGCHPQQIVQTVFKALLTSVEHRVREGFRFQGRAVMGPHRSLLEMMRVEAAVGQTVSMPPRHGDWDRPPLPGGEAPPVGGPPHSRSEERRQAALQEESGIPEHRKASETVRETVRESVRVVVDPDTPPWR